MGERRLRLMTQQHLNHTNQLFSPEKKNWMKNSVARRNPCIPKLLIIP
jgi:hypothetical protein